MNNEQARLQFIRNMVLKLFLTSKGILFLSLFSLCIFLLFVFVTGPIHTIDTQSYQRWADLLITNDFNLRAFFNEVGSIRIPRILFYSLVASLRLGFGEYWSYGLVTLNCLSLSLTGYFLMKILQKNKAGLLEILLVFLVTVVLYERIFWIRYLLSDTTFCLITTGLLCSLYLMIVRKKSSIISLAIPLSIFCVAFFYTPRMVILIPMLFAAFLIACQGQNRVLVTQYLFALMFVLGCLTLIGWAWYVNQPDLWENNYFSKPISRFYHWFYEGAVIKKRPHTYMAIPESTLDIVLIELARLIQFFRFTTPMFSPIHNIVNVISFIPLYTLVAVGIWRTITLLYRRRQIDSIGILSIVFIGSAAIFHSMTLIDYDWRYRLPCYPPIFLLAAGGVTFLKENFRIRCGNTATR